jgi:type IV pilus assembly protein PilY1
MKVKTSSLILMALSCSSVAVADDSEIFTGSQKAPVAPNILFILDTSGSMATTVMTPVPYDPTQTYGGSCKSNVIYFQSSAGNTPTGCGGMSSFSSSYQKCQAASTALSGSPGFYTDSLVQWHQQNSNYSWTNQLGSTNSTDVACKGDFDLGTQPFPTTYSGTSNSTTNEWATSTTATNILWNNNGIGGGYTLYSGNYLNYKASNPQQSIGTRISVVQQAASNLINSLSNVNVGLMRYSNNDGGSNDSSAAGGMVAYPVTAVSTARSDLITTLNSYTAGGWTPLSETLYEAYLYYSGGNVYFGNGSSPFKSVAKSRVGGSASGTQYLSPITNQCQKNFIVYLTDGLPTEDNQADSLITKLPNESTLGGDCDDTSKSPYNGKDSKGNAIPGGWGPASTAGKCMAPLAKYMYNTDMSSTQPGTQSVQLYTIGFGNDPALAAAASWLGTAAADGGGQFYQASDLNGLQTALTNIVSNILTTSSTFSAPSVSVNAFNRTQTLNDLYVSVFQPGLNFHWPGNVKKYSVQDGVIVDQNKAPAVDPTTGFFKDSAQSFWSAGPDGAKVATGGAASQLPSWDTSVTPKRNLYTYIGSNNPSAAVDLTVSSYAVTTGNTAITDAMLGLSSPTQHASVINYARGEDLNDENGNGSTTDTRHAMGDPIHAQSAVVIYGGSPSAKNINDAVVYAATNDGYLHAIDVVDGHELWAFIPQEHLVDLGALYSNSATSPKHYGLDGNIRVLKYDINGDGIVDPNAGDRVILYFGDGRGGSNYYALDVTAKATPKFMWSLSPATPGLAGLGFTWSTPTITRVKTKDGKQNSQFFTLVFGGGYDTAEEARTYSKSDSSGNGLYMVDALYGTVLWSAGPKTATPAPSLGLSRMDHAIPSDVAVLDVDGDGYADRMYVGDMAGQLWRFDIYEGNPVASLVTGGVIASLGAWDEKSPAAADTRRFYNAPDVAGVASRVSAPYLNIAIGSGYRGHPLDTTAQEHFYALRDYNAFNKLKQADYDNYAVVQDSNLFDITTNVKPTIPAGSPGWKLLLNQAGGGWVGEKVLAPSTTFENAILFTTYSPSTGTSANSCAPSVGTNRVYAVSLFDGSPVANLNNQGNLQISDRNEILSQGGIAPGVSILFPPPDPATGTQPPPKPGDPQKVVCTVGAEVLGVCKDFNSRVKTFWSEQDAN